MNVSFPKCNQAGTEFVISTTDDLQEKVNYLSEDFPVAIFTQTYHHAASDSTPFHWHNELQLNWVSEGELEYCINGDSLRLVEPMESEWMKSMIISERIGRPSRKKFEIGNTVLNQCEG